MTYRVRVTLRGGGWVDINGGDEEFVGTVVGYLRDAMTRPANSPDEFVLRFGNHPFVTEISRGEVVAFTVMEDTSRTYNDMLSTVARMGKMQIDEMRRAEEWKAGDGNEN